MFCSQCGSEATGGASFCSSCGARLATSARNTESAETYEYEDYIIAIPNGRRYSLAASYGVHPDQQEAARRTRMWDDHKDIIIGRINERGRDGWQLAGSEPLGPKLLTVIRGQDKPLLAWLIYGLGLLFFFVLLFVALAVDSEVLGIIGFPGFGLWGIVGLLVVLLMHGMERRWDQVTGCRVTLRRSRSNRTSSR